MLCENIKHFRKAKGISQEEMAVKLHVVRQTVSKWENGLSVPDADVLVHMAELLDVSVSRLLGIEAGSNENSNLSEELQKLNEELAKINRQEKLARQAGEKTGLIIFLSIAAMLLALTVKNEIASIALVGVCLLTAIVILYRNLALLTNITTDDLKTGILKAFDVLTFPKDGEKMVAMALVSCVMIFAGIISPKLPYSRHTGLRLPWTVCDEDTWNVAHRILGYVSLPVALLYIACALTIPNFETVTLCAVAVWIGIPGVISYVFFKKKMGGK